MSYNSIWIFLLLRAKRVSNTSSRFFTKWHQILKTFVISLPIEDRYDLSVIGIDQQPKNISPDIQKYEDTPNTDNEQVISVRITSSVAVGRGKEKLSYVPHKYEPETPVSKTSFPREDPSARRMDGATSEHTSDLPPNLIGANIEYIKQLHAKKDSKDYNEDPIHPFQLMAHGQHPNENESTLNETPTKIDDYDEDIKEIPTARKVPSSSNVNQFHDHTENRGYQHSNINVPMEFYIGNNPTNSRNYSLFETSDKFGLRINTNDKNNETNKKDIRDINSYDSRHNIFPTDDSVAESSIKSVEFAKTTASIPPSGSYIHSLTNGEKQNNARLTTVSFNIVHDSTKSLSNNERSESYVATSQIVPNQQFYDRPKTYSAPAQIYSEPAKFYSEPAKVYSEPAKVYSEPAKVYSEPAKIYSEPAKFYSEPASLHLNQNNPPSVPPNYSPWQKPMRPVEGTTINTTPVTAITNTYQTGSTQMEHQPERNYEIDEKISVLTDGRSHGVQESTTEKCKQDNCKVGYVVEGRQYKKYRVEERTPDGFIVGEYGVVRNEDGALRGVRYTADSDASPRLIHDALMKFLQLQ